MVHNKVDSCCARCGAAGELCKWISVSIDADEVVWLCQPCFQHALDRQRTTVEKNTIVLQSLRIRKRRMMADGFVVAGFAALALIMLFLLATAWPNYQNNGPGPYYFPLNPGYSPTNGSTPSP